MAGVPPIEPVAEPHRDGAQVPAFRAARARFEVILDRVCQDGELVGWYLELYKIHDGHHIRPTRWMLAVYTVSMTDYPDWQSFPTAQSANIFPAFSQTLTPGTHSTPVVAAANWSSLAVIVKPSAGAGQLQVNHYADAAGTQIIDSNKWPINTTTYLDVRTPLRGLYANLQLFVTSPGNLTATTWANFLSASSERISFPAGQQNVSDFNHSLAAGATMNYSPGVIAAGQAEFYIKPYDALSKLNVALLTADELGNNGQLVADFGTPAAIVRELITVPDLILRLSITNTDGANPHSYDFSLTIPPH